MTRDNFQNWINSVFGAGIAKYFMMPYNFKVWAHPLEMMSTSWQGDRVPNVDVGRILENFLENRDDVSWGPNNKFKYPLHGGTGELIAPPHRCCHFLSPRPQRQFVLEAQGGSIVPPPPLAGQTR